MLTFGINLPWDAGTTAANPRSGWIKNQGYVLLRGGAMPPSDITAMHTAQGCFTMPQVGAGGFKAYVDTLFKANGDPIDGWSGVCELGNEQWGNWAGGGNDGTAVSGGGAYWDKIRADLIACKAAHGPKFKAVVNAVAPNTPKGGSTPKVDTWCADMLARAVQRGDDFHGLVYALGPHFYTRGTNVKSTTAYPGVPWALKQFNDWLVANHMTDIAIWNTECGAGEYGTDIDSAFNDTSQNQWYLDQVAVAQNPRSFIPSLVINYEVCMWYALISAGTGPANEKSFHTIQISDFSAPPPNAVKFHPAATTARNANAQQVAAGANGNFTGTVVTPPPATGVQIAVDPSNTSRLLVTPPTGAAMIHVFEYQDTNGTGAQEPGTSGDMHTPFAGTFTPPADHPAVQMVAYDANTYDGSGAPTGNRIGGVTPIVLTVPQAASPVPSAATDVATAVTNASAILNGHADAHGVTGAKFHFNFAPVVNGVVGAIVKVPDPDVLVGDVSATLAWAAKQENFVNAGTSVVVTHAGFTDGRYLLAVVEAKGIAQTQTAITPGAGFVLIAGGDQQFTNAANGAHRLALYAKFASSEAGTTWGFSQSGNHIVTIHAFDGVNTTTPLETQDADTLSKVKWSVNPSALAMPVASALATSGELEFYGGAFTNADTVTASATTPTTTERSDLKTGATATDCTVATYTQAINATGLTGARTLTADNSSANGADTSATFAVVLRPAAAGTTNVAVAWPSPALLPGTTYQYALAVTSTAGTTVDPTPQTFTTPIASGAATAPTPQAGADPTVTATTVTLEGHVIPNGAATDYHFEYWPLSNPASVTSTTTLSVGLTESDIAFTISGLTPSTAYGYRLSTHNSVGTVVSSPDLDFTTFDDTTPPPPPSTGTQGLTLAQIRTGIQHRGFSTDTVATQNDLIQEFYDRIVGMRRWQWLEAVNTSLTTTPGVGTLSFATITDLRELDSVRLFLNGQVDELQHVDPFELRERAAANKVPSQPLYWTEYAGLIQFYPVPDQVYAVEIGYLKRPLALLDDTDVPIFDPSFHGVLIAGPCMELAERQRDWDAKAAFKDDYAAYVSEMTMADGSPQRQTGLKVKDSGFFS